MTARYPPGPGRVCVAGSADRAPERALARRWLVRERPGRLEQGIPVGVRGLARAVQVRAGVVLELGEPALRIPVVVEGGSDPAHDPPKDGEHRSSSIRGCYGLLCLQAIRKTRRRASGIRLISAPGAAKQAVWPDGGALSPT